MITELALVNLYGVTMTRQQVVEAVHVEARTLANWVTAGRFPKPIHTNARDGSIWSTQSVARYIDQATNALNAA